MSRRFGRFNPSQPRDFHGRWASSGKATKPYGSRARRSRGRAAYKSTYTGHLDYGSKSAARRHARYDRRSQKNLDTGRSKVVTGKNSVKWDVPSGAETRKARRAQAVRNRNSGVTIQKVNAHNNAQFAKRNMLRPKSHVKGKRIKR